MDTILQITVVAILGVVTILGLWFYSRLKKGKAIPKPKDHGNAWSNNAIRKHGKEGKGIRQRVIRMRVSKTADYALRVMVALAIQNGSRLSLQTLSTEESIPRKFLEHVVRSLKQAGLILSTPGPKGGYTLTRSAVDISLAQILTAVQGQLIQMDGLKTDSTPDHLKEPLDKLTDAMNDIRHYARQRLESVSLADLATMEDTGMNTEPLMYYI